MTSFATIPRIPATCPGRPSHHRLLPLYTANRPEVHAIVAQMRSVIDAYSPIAS